MQNKSGIYSALMQNLFWINLEFQKRIVEGKIDPGQIVLGTNCPQEKLSWGQIVPGQIVRGQIVPGQIVPGQIVPWQIVPRTNCP